MARSARPALGAARQHQRQRAGPEAGGQRAGLGREDGEALGGGEVGDVHDERVERRPPLGGEDAGHGAVAPRVGAEAVDGLGRKGDELARAQEARGGAEAALGSGKDDGVPLGHRRCLDRPPPGVNCASTLWGRAGPPKVAPRALSRGDAVAYRAPVGEMLFEGAQPLYASDLGLMPAGAVSHPWPEPPAPGRATEIAEGVLWARLPLPFRPDHLNVYAPRRRRRLDARRHRPRHRSGARGLGGAPRRAARREAGPAGDPHPPPPGPRRARRLVPGPGRRALGDAHRLADGADADPRRAAAAERRDAGLLARGGDGAGSPRRAGGGAALQLRRRGGADAARLPAHRRRARRSPPAGGAGGWRSATATRRSRRRSGASATTWCWPATRSCRASPPTSGSTPPSPTPTRWATGSPPPPGSARSRTEAHLALPGHRLPFRGLPARLAEYGAHAEAALARLRAHLAAPRRASECFEPLYGRRIGAAEYGLALAEAVGHLNRLTRAGAAVRRQGADGAWLWEARRNGA